MSITTTLDLFCRNYVLSDKILSIGLIAFICIYIKLLKSFRLSSLNKTWA